MANNQDRISRSFVKAVETMSRLRSECPWDKEQTTESLRPYLLEECYEVIEAIDSQDKQSLLEELGDLQLQVLFHAELAQEKKDFDIADILDKLVEKLIRRHPHVFQERAEKTPDQVVVQWESIKRQEKDIKKLEKEGEEDFLLDKIPDSLPSLHQAFQIQKKAAKEGFDWPDWQEAFPKLEEELKELKEVAGSDHKLAEKELGDLLFAIVNLARHLKIDPEIALFGSNRKFRSRFGWMEKECLKRGLDMRELTLSQLDALWEEAKELE